MKIKYLSASTISQFDKCPKQLFLNKSSEERIRSTALGKADLGTIVHEALRRFYEEGPGEKSLRGLYEEEWTKGSLANLNYYRDGLKMIARYESENPLTDLSVVKCELEFLENLKGKLGDIPVRGFIDRVDYHGDGVWEIVDYKTGILTKSVKDLEDDVQMSIYDFVFRVIHEEHFSHIGPLKQLFVSMYMIRYGKISYEYNVEQREQLLSFLESSWRKIGEAEPFEKLNDFCYSCPYNNGCDTYRRINDNVDISTLITSDPDVAAATLKDIRLKIKLLGKQKSEIEDYFMSMANELDSTKITLNHNVVDFGVKKYVNYKVQTVMDVLPDDWQKCVTVNKTKLKAFVNDAETERALLEGATANFSKPTLYLKEKK